MLIGTPNHRGNTLIVNGIDAPGAGLPTIELDDVSRFNEFAVITLSGSMTCRVSLDGINYAPNDLAFEDEHSTNPNTRVTSLGPGFIFLYRGTIKSIRLIQDGATGLQNAVLMCGAAGRD